MDAHWGLVIGTDNEVLDGYRYKKVSLLVHTGPLDQYKEVAWALLSL
jgi:hypothetical protein